MTSRRNGSQGVSRRDVQNAVSSMNVCSLEAARLLYFVKQTKLYDMWGFSGMSKYVKADLDIGYRKAMVLIQIYAEGTVRLSYTNAQLTRILGKCGWTKTHILLQGMEEKVSVQEFINYAQNSVSELSSDLSDVRQFHVALSNRYYRKLERILRSNGMGLGESGRRQNMGAAFEILIDSAAA